MSRKVVIAVLAIATVVFLAALLVGCTKKAPTAPEPTSTVQVVEDDDSCLSMEELIERDEDCGYAPTSKKPSPKAAEKQKPKPNKTK